MLISVGLNDSVRFYFSRSDDITPTPPRYCEPNQEFTCTDGTCVDIELKCDGHFDCHDGSDERECGEMRCFNFNHFVCYICSFIFACSGVNLSLIAYSLCVLTKLHVLL